MGSQLKEQVCLYDDIFENCSTFDWSMLCFKRWANLPIHEILKRKNRPLPNETPRDVTADEVYELDFIPHEVRMAAYCLHKGVPYIDDSLGLKVHQLLETNPELIEYCLDYGVCLYDIGSSLVIGVTNKKTFNELQTALFNDISTLTQSPLKETLESIKTSYFLIGVSTEHTLNNLKNIHTQNADPNLVLDDIFSPLVTIFEHSENVNASFFRFELEPDTNKVTSIQAFEHERSYCETPIDLKELPKLGFALKQLDNRYKAVASSENTANFLNIKLPNSNKTTHCRSKSSIRKDGSKTIFLEFIKSYNDQIESLVKSPLKFDLQNIRESLFSSIETNKSIIFSVPKNRCLRFINDNLLSMFIDIFKQGRFCLVINNNYFRYCGSRLIQLSESEITDELFMQHQFANAVLFGALTTKEQVESVSTAIDNFQTIVCVTHASKNQLPAILQQHTFTID